MLAAALGGLDAFEFSRHWGDLATIRARIAEKLAWLGVVFDPAANVERKSRISRPENQVMTVRRETGRRRARPWRWTS
jgi:acetate kinase